MDVAHTRKRSLEDHAENGGPHNGSASIRPTKAYRNADFLNSGEARLIRVMCELEEPKARLAAENVDHIVMFFGSARAKPRAEYEKALLAAAAAGADKRDVAAMARLKKQGFLVPFFDVVRDCAKLLSEWSSGRSAEGLPKYVVGTGGGPGMMEAANEGALLGGGQSVGFGISLPFEDKLNHFVSEELAFEFHYFFTRKFMMSYRCMGLVVAPGGFGTADELFEFITLMQTGKIKRMLPVILIGKEFWNDCINWQAFVDYGMISQDDKDQLIFCDTAEEAFEHLKQGLVRLEASGESLAP